MNEKVWRKSAQDWPVTKQVKEVLFNGEEGAGWEADEYFYFCEILAETAREFPAADMCEIEEITWKRLSRFYNQPWDGSYYPVTDFYYSFEYRNRNFVSLNVNNEPVFSYFPVKHTVKHNQPLVFTYYGVYHWDGYDLCWRKSKTTYDFTKRLTKLFTPDTLT